MSLRSARWFDGDDEVALDARVALASAGHPVAPGQPVIGLALAAGDLNPCNQPLEDLVAPLREGVEAAGGVAVAFPVMSLSEDVMKPAAMLYRNLVAMEVEESLRSQPIDGVVVMAACDKSVPGALMGAFSTNLPTLLVTAGPRPPGRFHGRRVGTGTDLWRAWDQRRSGAMSDDEWALFEAALTSGRGTCNTMGTASSLGVVAETLGLAWPGATSIPAGDSRHAAAARAIGERAVALVRAGVRPSSLTRAAFLNAVRALAACGGSTNAVIHVTAMARRLGVSLSLDDFDRAGREVPVVVDVEPTGEGLMEDFDAAGATPTLWRSILDLLDGSTPTATGEALSAVAASAAEPRSGGAIRPLDDAVDKEGAFRVVRGNLAPDGALIKRSAATPTLLAHEGPAIVLASEAAAREFSASRAGVDPASVIVLSGAGPVGGPGMPEWGMVSLPPDLVAAGVIDMVRVTDARMSGTSFGTVVLHVAPEAAVGGPIGRVRDGDVVRLDADAGRIDVLVSDEELGARDAGDRRRDPGRGYLALYTAHVQQAPEGCDLDFLAGVPGESPRLEEPVVGRS